MKSLDNQGNVGVIVSVQGRVQGVGFRYNTRIEARRRRLTGWVRNETDGSVTVVCEGEARQVASFLEWLEKGPPGARVAHIDVQRTPWKGIYSGFSVEY